MIFKIQYYTHSGIIFDKCHKKYFYERPSVFELCELLKSTAWSYLLTCINFDLILNVRKKNNVKYFSGAHFLCNLDFLYISITSKYAPENTSGEAASSAY